MSLVESKDYVVLYKNLDFLGKLRCIVTSLFGIIIYSIPMHSESVLSPFEAVDYINGSQAFWSQLFHLIKN